MRPDRNFPVTGDNLSSEVFLVGAFTGFQSFPHVRNPALNPYHRLRESPDPALATVFTGFRM
jgi:hypothetical protein